MMPGKYGRVLIKLSGETFCKPEERGLDIEVMRHVASEIKDAEAEAQCAIVVGGGNFVRGGEISQHGIKGVTGDYMGMLATVINALALQDVLESMDVRTRVMSSIQMHAVAEPFIRRRAVRHLEKNRVVILAAGTGNPRFTTDTAAALKATEVRAEIILKATTKVDGVYEADPLDHPEAKRFEKIGYLDVINKGLGIMDLTAISMCMEWKIPIMVFNIRQPGVLLRAIRGESIGTLISDVKTRAA